jgi:DNA-binding ferritin-like protein
MSESLADHARQATHALQMQAKVLEGDVSKIAELIDSQITAALEPVTNRIRDFRAQAEEANSTLETSLTRFAQKKAEAALAQTQFFESKVAAISEQTVSDVRKSRESRMTQLREIAMHKLEDETIGLSERLQRSHLENLKMSLDRMFEEFRAKLEVVQQESGNCSADLLSQMRKESEVIARDLHERLQSDAQTLAVNMVAMMRCRLQKLTEEFH